MRDERGMRLLQQVYHEILQVIRQTCRLEYIRLALEGPNPPSIILALKPFHFFTLLLHQVLDRSMILGCIERQARWMGGGWSIGKPREVVG